MKLFDLINPVKIMAFFTFYGGGSGGGGSSNPDTRYSNLDALYGTQNQASQYMLDNAMPKIPGLMKNSQSMVDEAMDGTLASTMRNRASYDANESISSANNDAIRNLTKYGAVGDPSGGRYADTVINNAKNASATRVGAMNKANQYAEDQKWNRNANMYGQVMGMNNGAMQGMSSAGAGMGAIAGQQTANDQRNAAGYGQAGAAFGSALLKADGGYINAPRLADGGDAWAKYKAANPVTPMGSSGGGGRTSALSAMFSGASPYLLAAGVKDVFKGDKGKIWNAAKGAYDIVNKASAVSKASEATSTIDDGLGLAQGYEGVQAVADGVDTASAVYDGVDAASTASDAVSAADAASTASDAASAASAASDAVGAASDTASIWSSVGSLLGMAKGGCVKKANAYAMGGLANNSVASSNKIDNTSSVAQMDASNAMVVNKMDQVANNKAETHAKPVIDTQYSGKTTGNFETSDGDPDGFGQKSPDKRHMVGKAVMSYYIPGGGLLAEVVQPIAEKATRNAISIGDKMGRATLGGSDAAGFAGAFGLDPIGTIMSGKYFADGGRVDHTDGGDVQGPGTETSDDIPAWLSDGEIVENADAVDLPEAHTKAVIAQWDKSGGSTKDLLLAINDAGLEKRKNQFACGGAVKHGVKLAGGGFLGGNLGIAMGAGVDEWNNQRKLTMMENADQRQAKEFGWKEADAGDKQRERDAQKVIDTSFSAPEYTGMPGSQRYTKVADVLANQGYGKQAELARTTAKTLHESEGVEKIRDFALNGGDISNVVKHYDPLSANRTYEERPVYDPVTKMATGKKQMFWLDNTNPEAPTSGALNVGPYENGLDLATRLHSAATGKMLELKKLDDSDEMRKALLEGRRDNAQLRSETALAIERSKEETRKQLALLKGGGGSSGNSSGSGSGTGSPEIEVSRFKPNERTDILKETAAPIVSADGKTELAGLPAVISASTKNLSSLSTLNPKVNEHEMVQVAHDLTKRSLSGKSDGDVSLQMDESGNFVPTISYKTAGGTSSYVINKPIRPDSIEGLMQKTKGADGKDVMSYNGMVMPSSEEMKLATRRYAESSLNELNAVADRLQGKVPGVDPEQYKKALIARGNIDGVPAWKWISNIPGELEKRKAAVENYASIDREQKTGSSRAPMPAGFDSKGWKAESAATVNKNDPETTNRLGAAWGTVRNWAGEAGNAIWNDNPVARWADGVDKTTADYWLNDRVPVIRK